LTESAGVTMFSREFQMAGAVQQKACLEKVVLWNGTDSC